VFASYSQLQNQAFDLRIASWFLIVEADERLNGEANCGPPLALVPAIRSPYHGLWTICMSSSV
ncbi:MAG: hypothetical protein WD875_00390, partial [Pirellulales bacterium]